MKQLSVTSLEGAADRRVACRVSIPEADYLRMVTVLQAHAQAITAVGVD